MPPFAMAEDYRYAISPVAVEKLDLSKLVEKTLR